MTFCGVIHICSQLCIINKSNSLGLVKKKLGKIIEPYKEHG